MGYYLDTINEIKRRDKEMTNKEKVAYLLKKFGDDYENIDLSYIDFGDRVVYNNGQQAIHIYNNAQKADEIQNSQQQANKIHNGFQKATKINNSNQKATEIILNDNQKADEIDNSHQVIKPDYEAMSKEELIARIKELENEDVNE